MTMNFDYGSEARKEFKKLAKKYKTLHEDIAVFEKVLTSYPTGYGKNFAVLSDYSNVTVVKARILSRSLKGAPTMRVVYAYYPSANQVVYIKFYLKSDKDREDRQRMKRFLSDS
jgi:hypothetical protein